MLVLGIESTCDETGCSIVRDGSEILSNVVASQHDIHSKYGGVFPELASRRHLDVIIPLIDQALKGAAVTLKQIDLIAVAHGPGLLGAILIGLNTAKAIALTLNKPLIGINHVEAHIYAAIMSQPLPPTFPTLGVVLSGAHTHIVHIKDIGHYELIAQTNDDAVGEAFDKVAKVMDIPYPGGPKIEELARRGNPRRFPFKTGRIKGRPLDFSFSGIKTAVLYAVKGQDGQLSAVSQLTEQDKADVAASFQEAVFDDIISKTLLSAETYGCNSVLFGGGVTNNRYLRDKFSRSAPGLTLHWPTLGLSLDNAAMIAGLGYHYYQKNQTSDPLDLEALTRIPFNQ